MDATTNQEVPFVFSHGYIYKLMKRLPKFTRTMQGGMQARDEEDWHRRHHHEPTWRDDEWYPRERDPATDACLNQMKEEMILKRALSDARAYYPDDRDYDARVYEWEVSRAIATNMEQHGVQCFLKVRWSSNLQETDTYLEVVTGEKRSVKTRDSPETPLLMIAVMPLSAGPGTYNSFPARAGPNAYIDRHVSICFNTDNFTYAQLRHIVNKFDNKLMTLRILPFSDYNLTYGRLDPANDPIASDNVVNDVYFASYYGRIKGEIHISL